MYIDDIWIGNTWAVWDREKGRGFTYFKRNSDPVEHNWTEWQAEVNKYCIVDWLNLRENWHWYKK